MSPQDRATPQGRATPQELVERALDASTADGCIVLVEDADRMNIRWANNTLTTNGQTYGRRVTVISTVDGQSGTAAGVLTRAGVEADTLGDLVAASAAAARAAGPSPDAEPLAEGSADDAFAEPIAHTSIGVFHDVASGLGRAFESARSTGRLLFGYAEHEMTTTYLGTSTGVRRRHAQPTGAMQLNAKSHDFSRSAYIGVATADFTDIEVTEMNERLSTRLEWAKRRVELPAGRYQTLLPPEAVADLITFAHFFGGVARDAVDGRSVYSRPGGGTRIGDQLCGDIRVTVSSNPYAAGLVCPPFVMAHANSQVESIFDDGLPLAPTDWIRDGVLTNLLATRHVANTSGVALAPFIDNLTMTASTGGSGASLDEMVASTDRGLLLTCIYYVRPVDPQTLLLTGLTRDGVYLVEDGEVTGAVNNFRFNESPVEMLRRIAEVGRTERAVGREFGEYFNRAAMPAIRVPDFNMSSVSQAA
jgi:predicted Zn-dependent protease